MSDELTEVARDIGARLFAMQAGLLAVIATHPNPQGLATALTNFEDAGLANMQYLPWSEDHISVYRASIQLLREKIPRT